MFFIYFWIYLVIKNNKNIFLDINTKLQIKSGIIKWVLREKIKKKTLFFPILTTIIIGFIAVLSNQKIVMNSAIHTDSGNNKNLPYILLEREVNHAIEWDFTSTSNVTLLIIKRGTYEDLRRLALEIPPPVGGDYLDIFTCLLEDYYASRGNQTDSGKFYVNSSGIHMIWFETLGFIKYCVKVDPYSTDFIGFFYTWLGVTTTIGISSYAYKFRKLVKMKPKSEKEIIMRNYQIKVSCERCGIQLDSDSIFCHECGIRLKIYILNRIV